MMCRIAFEKSDCETSKLVAPLLAQLAADNVLDEVVSQDEEFWNLDSSWITRSRIVPTKKYMPWPIEPSTS